MQRGRGSIDARGDLRRAVPVQVDHLEIPVLPLSALRDTNPDCVRHFTQLEPEAFSGVTVFSGQRRMVVYTTRTCPGASTATSPTSSPTPC